MKLFYGNGSQNTYPNKMKYYAEKYFGYKAIWRTNFKGFICGYNNDSLIMSLENDTRMRGLSRIDLSSYYISEFNINDKYMYCQPQDVIGMDPKDQFDIGLEKEFFIGNYCMFDDLECKIDLICHKIRGVQLEIPDTDISFYTSISSRINICPSYLLVDGILTAKHVLQNTNTINNGGILRLTKSKFYE